MLETIRAWGAIIALSALAAFFAPLPASAAGADPCNDGLTRDIPARATSAPSGSAAVRSMLELSGGARDRAVEAELTGGNLPGFLRQLTPVRLTGAGTGEAALSVTICVMPDYLSVGSNADFVRVPLGLPAAADIAERFGFLLPTTRMVDAIYAQAPVRLAPQPMPPTAQMSSTDYFWRHNQTVAKQRASAGAQGLLTAGQKKDIVLSNRLRKAHGRVAIYGWHRHEGAPIQPLSTVHGASYADYSHGVRLVSTTAFVDGQPRSLARLLESPKFAKLLSSEGPIAAPGRLLASLR